MVFARGSISHKALWRWAALMPYKVSSPVAGKYFAHAIMPLGGALASKRLARAGANNALDASRSGCEL